MKPIAFTAFFLFCLYANNSRAQRSISTAGGDASGISGSVSYTIGQLDYISDANTTGSLNEGVQQPYELFSNAVEPVEGIHLQLLAFPNPTPSQVRLLIKNLDCERLSFSLFDVDGKLLCTQKISSVETTVPMETFPSGTYLLNVLENQKGIKTFRIVKNR